MSNLKKISKNDGLRLLLPFFYGGIYKNRIIGNIYGGINE